MDITQNILSYMERHSQEAQDLLITLAQIPAPSNQEEQRAEFCANWLRQQGAQGVYIDEMLIKCYTYFKYICACILYKCMSEVS